MVFANVLLLIVNLPLVGVFASLLAVPMRALMPIVAVFVLMGSYFINNAMADLGFAIVFGVVGYFLRRTGYSIAPMVIGLFLGPLVEKGFVQSMVLTSGDILRLFERPLSGTMLGAAILFIVIKLGFAVWRGTKKAALGLETKT
jgi:putative tricarboxylic transport membrane protein